MFYQVRIFNPKGTVKKIISSAELSKIHWNKFQALAGKNKTNVLENKLITSADFIKKVNILREKKNITFASKTH